jgi:hypothetical protein
MINIFLLVEDLEDFRTILCIVYGSSREKRHAVTSIDRFSKLQAVPRKCKQREWLSDLSLSKERISKEFSFRNTVF